MTSVMRMTIFLVLSLVPNIIESLEPFPEETEYFRLVTEVQKQVCPADFTCSSGLILVGGDAEPRRGEKCCGYCTCDDKCSSHGSCCLNMYGSFEVAREYVENSR